MSEGTWVETGWTKLSPSCSKFHWWASLSLRYPKSVAWESPAWKPQWAGPGFGEPEPGNSGMRGLLSLPVQCRSRESAYEEGGKVEVWKPGCDGDPIPLQNEGK